MGPQQRPRVEGEREEQILDATIDLLLEGGYDRLTMDAVARGAKASKATLYRRWESKADLVIDALVRAKGMPDPTDHDTGSLRGDLIATFCGKGGMVGTRGSEVTAAVFTALAADPEFAARFREEFVAPKIAITMAIYQRAVARGEVSPDTDLEIIAPALAATVMHRSLLLGAPLTDELVARVVDHLIVPAATYGAPGARPTHKEN